MKFEQGETMTEQTITRVDKQVKSTTCGYQTTATCWECSTLPLNSMLNCNVQYLKYVSVASIIGW